MTALDGMPEGKAARLGGMSDGESRLFGLAPDLAGGRAQGVADMARIVPDTGGGAGACRDERRQDGTREHKATQGRAGPFRAMHARGASGRRGRHGDGKPLRECAVSVANFVRARDGRPIGRFLRAQRKMVMVIRPGPGMAWCVTPKAPSVVGVGPGTAPMAGSWWGAGGPAVWEMAS